VNRYMQRYIWIDTSLFKLVFCGQLNRLFKTGYLLFLVVMCWIFVPKVSCLRPVASSALYLLLYGRNITFLNVRVTTSMSWFEVHVELMSRCWPSFYLSLGLVKSVYNRFRHFNSGVFSPLPL